MSNNNLLAMAMPLVSYSIIELLKHTINFSNNINSIKKTQLIKLLSNINSAPGSSYISVRKNDITIEIYLELDDYSFNVDNNIKEVCAGLDRETINEIMKSAGNLILFVNMYFEAIKERVPDIFNNIKKELNISDINIFEGVYVDNERKMYFNPECPKRIIPKFKKVIENDKNK